MNNTLTFRFAKRSDTALILQFIKKLAAYEKMLDEVVANEATLETWIFDKTEARRNSKKKKKRNQKNQV